MADKDTYFGEPLMAGGHRGTPVDPELLRPKVYPKTVVEVHAAPGVEMEHRRSALMWSYSDEVRYGGEVRVLYDQHGQELIELQAKLSDHDIKALAETLSKVFDEGSAAGVTALQGSLRKLIGAVSYKDCRPPRFG